MRYSSAAVLFSLFDFLMFRLIALRCPMYPLRAVQLRRVHVSLAAISSTLPLMLTSE